MKKRFKKLKDGWIRDALLGLDWGPSSTDTMIKEIEGAVEIAKRDIKMYQQAVASADNAIKDGEATKEDFTYDVWYASINMLQVFINFAIKELEKKRRRKNIRRTQ